MHFGKDKPKRMSAIQANGSTTESRERDKPGEGRVAKLRRQLQEAEIEETLAEAHNQTNGIVPCITSTDANKQMHLGPVISTKVELEGSITDALLDTGSPATIVSLEFLMKALWKQKPAEQSREEWDEYFKKRTEPPDVTLQNYGGDRINTVGQVRVTISRGAYSHETVIQVQRHGPVPLLIRTNLQAKLGFMFLQTNPDGTAVNLLNQQEVQIKQEATTADAVVHLVQPVHLPCSQSWKIGESEVRR